VNPLIGTWTLAEYFVCDAAGGETRWDGPLKGALSYSDDGHVSALVDRSAPGDDEAASERAQLRAWYKGAYEIADGGTVIHVVRECSDPARIGEKLIRHYRFENGNLILSGQGMSAQVRLVWKKQA